MAMAMVMMIVSVVVIIIYCGFPASGMFEMSFCVPIRFIELLVFCGGTGAGGRQEKERGEAGRRERDVMNMPCSSA